MVFCIGYHAMVGHGQGVLNETWWGRELYDLRNNPEETSNLWSDPSSAGVKRELLGLLRDWRAHDSLQRLRAERCFAKSSTLLGALLNTVPSRRLAASFTARPRPHRKAYPSEHQ